MRDHDLSSIEGLPRWGASEIKNKFADFVRQVRGSGVVAITRHSTHSTDANVAMLFGEMRPLLVA